MRAPGEVERTRAVDPVRTVVLGVIAEALRSTGTAGLRLSRPGTPEHDLVAEWARGAGWQVEAADLEAGRPPPAGSPGSSSASPPLLPTDPGTKLLLLLEGPTPGARLLPLGDLWPEGFRVRAEGITLPGWLPPAEADRVAGALRAALEEGYGLPALETRLPASLSGRVREALLRTAPHFRPPIIPKLTGWTPGIDPGL